MTPRNSFEAWGPQPLWDAPGKIRGIYVGSYGINGWLCEPVLAAGETNAFAQEFVPKRESSLIPAFFDCAHFETYPRDSDPAVLYHHGAPLDGMSLAALDRHRSGVNVSFVDGHAEYVTSEGLWKLKWSRGFVAREVVVRR